MSIFGKLLGAPAAILGGLAGAANAATEAVIGDNLDVFDIEEKLKELARDIEEGVDRD